MDIDILKDTEKRLENNDTSFSWQNIRFENIILEAMRDKLENNLHLSDNNIQKILEKLYEVIYD